MKVLSIFLTFILWTETPRASVIKQDEPFMELRIDPADGPLHLRNQNEEKRQGFKKVTQREGKPLSAKDFDNAKLLNASRPDFKTGGNPIFKAGLFEGDIDGINVTDMLKNAIRDLNQRWPSAKIPYAISDAYDDKERSVIAKAMTEFHDKTCIQFVPKTSNDKDYVNIEQGPGCFAQVGRAGGAQKLSLAKSCLDVWVIVHELMHSVGFWHEQSRADRDDYITIVWDNVQKGQEHAFQKFEWDSIQDLGEAYDFGSIMHYEAHAFAQDSSQPTIIPKEKGKEFGTLGGFSDADLRKIKKLYQCPT